MQQSTKIVKYTAKDSVFADLFRDKKYLLQLYQALHPEDKAVTEDSFSDITINNVLVDGQYNDLGFMVHGKLMILIEAQSTWTMNIIVRALFYYAQSLQEYLDREGVDLYGSRKVKLPESELYVIYTGDRKKHPAEVSFIDEFFEGRKSAIEIKVRMLYGTVNPDFSQGEDIIGQYVLFTKVFNEQIHIYGRTPEAVEETIRICMDQDILKEYLGTKRKEVITMMMDLYDQDRIMEIHIASERKIAAEEAEKKAEKKAEKRAETEKRATIERMLRDGELSVDKIASFLDISVQKVREIEAGMLQEV